MFSVGSRYRTQPFCIYPIYGDHRDGGLETRCVVANRKSWTKESTCENSSHIWQFTWDALPNKTAFRPTMICRQLLSFETINSQGKGRRRNRRVPLSPPQTERVPLDFLLQCDQGNGLQQLYRLLISNTSDYPSVHINLMLSSQLHFKYSGCSDSATLHLLESFSALWFDQSIFKSRCFVQNRRNLHSWSMARSQCRQLHPG